MTHDAYYPEPLELEAYGNGGFRFGEMSHKGSLLILQSGIHGWDVSDFEEVRPINFQALFDDASSHEFLIFGTGETQRFPSRDLKEAFIEAGLGLEVMDTGAAARTYNVLISEGRKVAAALIAVD
ncbi:MAG: hypothetical protein JJ964_02520 [Rhizobiales bacterium]|nr:hypothetical protein [Hyphomicrobiales bacterium]